MSFYKTRGSIATCASILSTSIKRDSRLKKQLTEVEEGSENHRRLTDIKRKNEKWIKHLEDKLQGLLTVSIANR